MMKPKMNLDRAARRYFQIRELERAVTLVENSIIDAEKERDGVEERISELRAQKRGLQKDMRDAARDDNELPLIDMMEALANVDAATVPA